MMNTIASVSFCLSNEFIRSLSELTRLASSVAELSPQAIKALEDSRDRWQSARSQDFSRLLFATKLVAVGVLLEGPELVYELLNVIKRWMKRTTREHAPTWITFVGLVGWILVSIGVAGEFWIDGRVNSDDDNIQSINISLLRDAGASASQAKADAGNAHNIAQSAADIARPAKVTADSAKGEADQAQTLARGARTEADSFEKDIVSAKSQAADAESRLADALERVTTDEKELNLLKSPRQLDVAELAEQLRKYAGTEYTFTSVVDDLEAVEILRQIDSALQLAGWKRVKPFPEPTVSMAPFDKEPDFKVALGASIGVEVEVDSTVSVDILRQMPQPYWPSLVQTAGALRSALALRLTPTKGNVNKDLVVKPGSSPVVRITVGRKP